MYCLAYVVVFEHAFFCFVYSTVLFFSLLNTLWVSLFMRFLIKKFHLELLIEKFPTEQWLLSFSGNTSNIYSIDMP